MDDRAYEASRRAGWGRYFATRRTLDAERLARAELAVWFTEMVELPAGHPACEVVADALADTDRRTRLGIVRYVRWRLAGNLDARAG